MNHLKPTFFSLATLLLILLFPQMMTAQGNLRVTGSVRSSTGEPMPFVNVYVLSTMQGTTTNANGHFSVELSGPGEVDLVFQFVGYQKQIKRVSPGATVDVVLNEENVELPQFVVSANGRDPAYAIIEQAQAKRKEYLNQVDAYSAEVYLKGATRLNEIPENRPFLIPEAAMPDSTDLGLIFLSEAVSRYHFEQPNKFKEEMVASKVAGFSQAFSWNRAEDVLINFYENNVVIGGISDRGFISPIGTMAMMYYRYKLLGSFKDDAYTVYKIEVTPRRTIDPAFAGIVYITDSLYNIHSLDLTLYKNTGIEFVDTVHIDQTFVPVAPEQGIWMPLSLKMHLHFSVFGFKASHDAVAEFSEYELEKVFDRKFFSNETFRVDESANKKDSLFWSQARQVVLTEEEVANYYKGDSLEAVRSSEPYLDSIDRMFNKPTVGKLLLTGYERYNRFDSLRYGINPLISFVQYNTVEGLVIDAQPYFRKALRESNFAIQAHLRYGFSSEQFYGLLKYAHLFNYHNFRGLKISGGHYVSQFNRYEPISPILNTSYTLFDKRNMMKLYEKTYGRIGYQQELTNGIFLNSSVEYAQRNPLYNTTDYTWSGKKDRQFTPNNPPGRPIAPSNALVMEVNLRFRINQKYETFPSRKRIIGSVWPTIFVNYRKGIQALESDVNYDFVSAGLSYDLNLGQLGRTKLDVDAGTFLNNRSMYFYDYEHFNGNQTGVLNQPPASPFQAIDYSRARLSNFQNMDYYGNSTRESYVRIHAQHHFHGFIFNKLPLIRKLRLQLLAGANFLYSEPNNDHTEVFIGIENILKVLRIDMVATYEYGKPILPVLRIGTTIGI